MERIPKTVAAERLGVSRKQLEDLVAASHLTLASDKVLVDDDFWALEGAGYADTNGVPVIRLSVRALKGVQQQPFRSVAGYDRHGQAPDSAWLALWSPLSYGTIRDGADRNAYVFAEVGTFIVRSTRLIGGSYIDSEQTADKAEGWELEVASDPIAAGFVGQRIHVGRGPVAIYHPDGVP